MKLVIVSLLTVMGLSAQAAISEDAKDLGQKLEVSNQCAAKILSQTTRKCNADSKAKEGADREHGCFYSYDMTGFTMEHPNEGTFEVVFTAGDDDVYNYLVYVTDEEDQNDCSFTIKANNQ